MLSYEQIQKKRKYILDDATDIKIEHRHARSLRNGRLCAVCGRPLTYYVWRTGQFGIKYRHYHYKTYGGLFEGSLCYSPKDCYKYLKQKEGGS